MKKYQEDNIAILKKIIQENSKLIEFDEKSHTYIINGEEVKSVSHWQDKYKEKFDKNIASHVSKKYNSVIRKIKTKTATEIDIKYAEDKNIDLNIIYNKEKVLEDWDKKNKLAINIGIKVHSFVEKYPKFPKTKDKRCLQVKKWFKDNFDKNRYIIIGHELMFYSKELHIVGTVDLLLYDLSNDTLILIDWKNNLETHEEFENKSYNNLLHGLKKEKATHLNYYSIQQNFYKILIEENTNFKVSKSLLIHITENSYKEFDCKDYIAILKKERENFYTPIVKEKAVKGKKEKNNKNELDVKKIMNTLKVESFNLDISNVQGDFTINGKNFHFYIQKEKIKSNLFFRLILEEDLLLSLLKDKESLYLITLFKDDAFAIVNLNNSLLNEQQKYKRKIKDEIKNIILLPKNHEKVKCMKIT